MAKRKKIKLTPYERLMGKMMELKKTMKERETELKESVDKLDFVRSYMGQENWNTVMTMRLKEKHEE